MSFAEPRWLLALLALLPLAALTWAVWRSEARRRAALGEPRLLLRSGSASTPGQCALRLALGAGALAFCVLALARPQVGFFRGKLKSAGIDVIICLDVSNSMRAEDIGPNRLQAALRLVQELAQGLAGNRVGLVTFSDAATTVCPLTTDIDALLTMLGSVDFDTVGRGGTALATAISEAARRFDPEHKLGRALVLISDGEDNEQTLEEAIRAAKEHKIVVYCVGAGTARGAPIPEPGPFRLSYKKYRGQTVISRLREDGLKRLARSTGGAYFALARADVAPRLLAALARQPGKRPVERETVQRRELFQVPLAVAFALLVAQTLVGAGWPARRRERGQ